MAERGFQAVYYRARDGSEPVDAYVDRLPERHQAILVRQLDRLNSLSEQVPHLPAVRATPGALARVPQEDEEGSGGRDSDRRAALAGLQAKDGCQAAGPSEGGGERCSVSAVVGSQKC